MHEEMLISKKLSIVNLFFCAARRGGGEAWRFYSSRTKDSISALRAAARRSTASFDRS
jgi:hypothetical protein